MRQIEFNNDLNCCHIFDLFRFYIVCCGAMDTKLDNTYIYISTFFLSNRISNLQLLN